MTDMVEIDAGEYAQLQRGFNLLNKMLSDGNIGVPLKRAIAKEDPSITFPELAAESVVAPVNEKLSELQASLAKIQEERDAERQAAKESASEAKLRSGIDKARDKYKLTDDGVQGLIAFMTENQVANPMVAAAAYVESLPKPPPAAAPNTFAPQTMNLFGANTVDETLQDLHTDPMKWQDAEIARILNEAA